MRHWIFTWSRNTFPKLRLTDPRENNNLSLKKPGGPVTGRADPVASWHTPCAGHSVTSVVFLSNALPAADASESQTILHQSTFYKVTGLKASKLRRSWDRGAGPDESPPEAWWARVVGGPGGRLLVRTSDIVQTGHSACERTQAQGCVTAASWLHRWAVLKPQALSPGTRWRA